MSGGDAFTFSAFISYARADRAEAVRLQRRLEQYRLDEDLRVDAGERVLPAKPLQPVFRDEDELIPGQDLPERIRKGLEQARFLIVLASPAAAQSTWVEKEILDFMALGKADRIIVLVIAGEPNALRAGKTPQAECLPRPFRFKFGPDRQPTDEVVPEPLWVDWRGSKKRDRITFLRLVAALLELKRFDDLVHRDAQRERRRLRAWTFGLSVAGAIVLGLAALTAFAIQLNTRTTSRLFAEIAAQAVTEERYEAAMRWALAGLRTGESEFLPPDDDAALAVLTRAFTLQPLHRTLSFRSEDEFYQYTYLSFSGDGGVIATGQLEGKVRLWDTKTGTLRAAFAHEGRLEQLFLLKDGSAVLTVADDGTIRLWDIQTLKPRYVLSEAGTHVVLLADQARMAVGGETLRIFNLATGALERTVPIETSGALSFFPDGRRIAAVVEGGVKIIDLASGAAGAMLAAPGLIYDVAIPEDGAMVAVLTDQTVHVFDTATGGEKFKAAHQAPILTESLDFPTLIFDGIEIIASNRFGARSWNVSDGTFLDAFPYGRQGLEKSKLGFIAAADGGNITILNSGLNKVMAFKGHSEEGHGAEISRLAFSPDGRMLASSSQDGIVKLWIIQPEFSHYGDTDDEGKRLPVWTFLPQRPSPALLRADRIAKACARLQEIGERRFSEEDLQRPIMAGRGADPCVRHGLLSWRWYDDQADGLLRWVGLR